jgi:hypothetical protein
MKKQLRLGFTDTFGSINNYFVKVLSARFDIFIDDEDPDILIFGDRNFGSNNISYDDKRCIKVFYTGENERPWGYHCHFSISFDHDECEGKNYRLPLYVIYDHDNHHRDVPNTSTINRKELDLLQGKPDFCSFVVKNGGCEMRNKWFRILDEYRPVASAGPHYNNTGYILPRGEESVYAKIQFLNSFKFNMCFENSSHPGYATEKLYEALCAKTVPIYWGSPTIEVDFNPKAFLNWHDYGNDEDFLEAIKKVDQSEELYREMYLQPMFVNGEKRNKFFDEQRFLNWFERTVYKEIR